MKEVKAKQIEIATDRLIIRTPDERNIHDIFVLMSDLEIAASTGFRPMSTLSEAEGKIRGRRENPQGDGRRADVLYFRKEPS